MRRQGDTEGGVMQQGVEHVNLKRAICLQL